MEFNISPLGDHGAIIDLGKTIDEESHERVKQVTAFLNDKPFDWLIEYIPAFTTVALFYDPVKVMEQKDKSFALPYEIVRATIEKELPKLGVGEKKQGRVVEIPVCYGGDLGPDLTQVARHNDLTEEEVIEIHTAGDYLVYMIGFAPGFPYIGGMKEEIATAIKEEPRLRLPAGSVGIAGSQTGVYPIETPGGWQLIGQTPVRLFKPDQEPPSLLHAGDKVVFKAITRSEFDAYKEEQS